VPEPRGFDVALGLPGGPDRRLIDALRLYTGRFSENPFVLKQYDIAKVDDKRALVPYIALSPGFKKAYLSALWPQDEMKAGFWHHRVTYRHETLWTIAQLYTGFGRNYSVIRRSSGLKSDSLRIGMQLKIPEKLILYLLTQDDLPDLPKPPEPQFASQTQVEEAEPLREETVPQVTSYGEHDEIPVPQLPAVATEEPAQATATEAVATQTPDPAPTEAGGPPSPEILEQLRELRQSRGELTYGSGAKGPFARYRLKAGEALYSAVVVRFCGLVRAADVNRLAEKLIERNNIRDVTDLPIGFAIDIPLEYLEPEFKPADDPEYKAYVENLEAVARVSTSALANNLEGVVLILDPGHGGLDPGADRKGVWEDDFVYDIVCRIKRKLERESAATVLTTVLDPSVNYEVQDVNRFSRDMDEVLLTTPRFHLRSQRVSTDGVNLRWMLANNRFEDFLKKGVKAENVIFASFHADALHRSIRGSMVYVPDARDFPTYVKSYSKFSRYAEASGNDFKMTRPVMQQAQARSTRLAENYIKQIRKSGLRVHPHRPVRSLIYRNPHKPFVPAVLNYNRIPTRILVEACNLNNQDDQDLLKQPSYRQELADAFVAAVYQTYGASPTATGSLTEAALHARRDE